MLVGFCFYQGFLSMALTIHKTARKGRGQAFIPLYHFHPSTNIQNLQLCMWDDYNVFLIAMLVFTRLLLDEMYHLIKLAFDWLVDDALVIGWIFFTYWFDSRFLLQQFDTGNWRIWTHIDYHLCITSQLIKQVC